MCSSISTLQASELSFVAGGDGSGSELKGDAPVTPCGGCRQALLEAAHLSGTDIEILAASGDGTKVERLHIHNLLPHGFGPANLADSA